MERYAVIALSARQNEENVCQHTNKNKYRNDVSSKFNFF